MKPTSGQTLIELLITIIVIAVLSAIAIPTYLSQRNKAESVKVLAALEDAKQAIETYAIENGKFPPDQLANVRPPQIPASVWPNIPGIDYDAWGLGNRRCIAQITWFGLNQRRDSPVYTDAVGGDDRVLAIGNYPCDEAIGPIR